jgi:hypothetical protein
MRRLSTSYSKRMWWTPSMGWVVAREAWQTKYTHDLNGYAREAYLDNVIDLILQPCVQGGAEVLLMRSLPSGDVWACVNYAYYFPNIRRIRRSMGAMMGAYEIYAAEKIDGTDGNLYTIRNRPGYVVQPRAAVADPTLPFNRHMEQWRV